MTELTHESLVLIGGIRQRIRALRRNNLTPWRIELGREQIKAAQQALEILGYPVEAVPVDDYFRVAYLEWAYERLPDERRRQPREGDE
jgi:hypothetical protein